MLYDGEGIILTHKAVSDVALNNFKIMVLLQCDFFSPQCLQTLDEQIFTICVYLFVCLFVLLYSYVGWFECEAS